MLKLIGHYRRYIHEEDVPYIASPYSSPARGGAGGDASSSGSPVPPGGGGGPRSSGGDRGGEGDNALKGHGMVFEHAAFMAFHRCGVPLLILSATSIPTRCSVPPSTRPTRNEKARHFLSLFRHSQMFEVFVQERLLMATKQYDTNDAFERRLVW